MAQVRAGCGDRSRPLWVVLGSEAVLRRAWGVLHLSEAGRMLTLMRGAVLRSFLLLPPFLTILDFATRLREMFRAERR